MAQLNTQRFPEKHSQNCDDLMEFELDDELDDFLEQFEAIPIEVTEENYANSSGEEIKKENSGNVTTIVETNNVLQKEIISEEKKKELLISTDSLESGECCSSESESLDSKAGLLKGRSLYQQVLDFKDRSIKSMCKYRLPSEEINEKNDLDLPGKARSRKNSSSSFSSSLSGKETIILPLKDDLPQIGLDETDAMEEKLKSRGLAVSPPLVFEDCLDSYSLLKDKTLSSFHKHVKQDILLFENKLSPISRQSGLDDHTLKMSEKMEKYSKTADKDNNLMSISQTPLASVVKTEIKTELNELSTDCKAEATGKKSSPFSPISSSSSSRMEKKKDMLSLSCSSISPPTDENDPLAQNQNATSALSLITGRKLTDYGSLSPEPLNATEELPGPKAVNGLQKKKEKKKKKKKSKLKKRSKSKSKEKENISGQRKTYSRSPVRQRTRSRSRSLPIKKGQRRSSRSIERYSKSRSRSVERRTAKKRRRSFSISRSRSRSTDKRSHERQSQSYKRSRSRSYEKGVFRNQSYRRSPSHRSRPRSSSVERRTAKRPRRYYRKSRSRSIESRKIKRSSRSKSRSPYKRVSKSPIRKRRLSRSPIRKRGLSRSPIRKRSLSRSPTRKRSLSRSPTRKRSLSRSPTRKRSLSRSPRRKRSLSRSPTRKRSLSKTPPTLRKASSSMSISPLTPDENKIFTNMPAFGNPKKDSFPHVDANPPLPRPQLQPQPIPSVVGRVVQLPPRMGNHTNYYDNYCYNQEVPYAYHSSIHIPEPQPSYYHPLPPQNYWSQENDVQDRNFCYNQQRHYDQQTNLRPILLTATVPTDPTDPPVLPVPPPLPSVPPLPPLPLSEPVPPPPPPPPETDNSAVSTPEKAKPSRLISRLKSNLRYILPEITKKVHSAEVVKLIDNSLRSPKKAPSSVSSSPSSLGEETPKERKEQAEKCILENLQEVTFESTSASKDFKPSSESQERQPAQMLACNSTSSKKEDGKENNHSVAVEPEMIPSAASMQYDATKQTKAYSILKPKSSSKYSPVVMKLLPRQKLVPNVHFTDTDNDEETMPMDTDEQKAVKQIPLPPVCSSSLILINTSGALSSKEQQKQNYPMGFKRHPSELAEDKRTISSFPEAKMPKNSLTDNCKKKENVRDTGWIYNNINGDKSNSLRHTVNGAFANNNALKTENNIKLENAAIFTCKSDYKSKDFKAQTVTETTITCNNAGEDKPQKDSVKCLEHMTGFPRNTETKISNNSSQHSKTDTSTIEYRGISATADKIEKQKHKAITERVFGLRDTGTAASVSVSKTVTKAETKIKSENVFQSTGIAISAGDYSSNTLNATTKMERNDFSEKISKSTIQRVYGENKGCNGTSTFESVSNDTTKPETKVKSENATHSHAESDMCKSNSTKEGQVTAQANFGYTIKGTSNGQVDTETPEPIIQTHSEGSFSNALQKEDMKEVTSEVSRSNENKQSNLQHKINNKHVANEGKLLPLATNDRQIQVKNVIPKTNDSVPEDLNKKSQEESNAFTNVKENPPDNKLTQDVQNVKQKTATFEQEIIKSDCLKDLKQNSINSPLLEPMHIKEERRASTETYSSMEVSNCEQATNNTVTVDQNFNKNEKVTPPKVLNLNNVANKPIIPEVSHTEKSKEQDKRVINTQLKNEAPKTSNILYDLVPEFPDFKKVKMEASSNAENKRSLSKHKDKADLQPAAEKSKSICKAKKQQKKTEGSSPHLNTEISQQSDFPKSSNVAKDAVSNSVSPLALSSNHKSNAAGKKHKHKCHDKEQTSLIPQGSNATETQVNIAEHGNIKSTNDIAVLENTDVTIVECDKSTKLPETPDASEERKNQCDIVGPGTKEEGDELGESSKGKGYDLEHVGIVCKKRHRKRKEQNTAIRAATVQFGHRKQIWEDPKLNMDVKIQLERCKGVAGTINVAVNDHISENPIKTEEPQDENVELKVTNKVPSYTETSLPTHTSVATCTSKNTKDSVLEKSKSKDSSRKSKSKEQKSKTSEDTSSAVQNCNKVSTQGSAKEGSKDLTEVKVLCDNKSKIAALEKALALLTVPRRHVSTQVKFKAKTLQGTHEVKGHRAPMSVDSAIISSLKEILHQYKTGT